MASIQRSFLPKYPFQRYGGIELFFVWEPAEEVGGDYFFATHSERAMTIEIGDVIGHGMDAALAMTALNGVFFGLRASALPPEEKVSAANSFICKLEPTDKIMTSSVFVIHIDVVSGIVRYTNAGHPYPLYVSAADDDPTVLELISGGTLLGVREDMPFISGQLRARKNDFIVMFTDGFSEALNPQGQEFADVNDLRELVKSCAGLSAEEIVLNLRKSLDDFRAGVKLHDDLTIVGLKFTDRFNIQELSR